MGSDCVSSLIIIFLLFKLESGCKFCNQCHLCDSLIGQANDVTQLAHKLSHQTLVQVPKSKYNRQCV